MSGLENIGQRMVERLMASGLLSFVDVGLQSEESLVLVLVPVQGIVLSERVMRFCVDFLGRQRKREERRNVFGWCSSNIEEISDQRCRIWVWGDLPADFDVMTALILLGLRLSRELPPSSVFYESSNLLRVYQTREDVLAFYERFVAQVIQAGDDLPTQTCSASLRDLWLCCEKHRFLFVQRLMLNDWLDYFVSVSGTWDNSYLHPSLEELKQCLAHLLECELTPQEWLKARAEYAAKSEEHGWDLRPPQCGRSRYVNWACCTFHRAMMAYSYLLCNWLELFNNAYHVAEMKDENGFTPDLISPAGVALLVKLARLDTHTIPQTEWFAVVCAVNTDEYHLK